MLVFEDLQWADTGTLDLLEVLASRVRDVPLMLLALARPDLLVIRPAWGGGLLASTTVSLEALKSGDARELATRLLPRAADHQRVRVVETAEGNPLFIEELAAAAIERPAAVAADLPTTIRELVSARLDALPSDERTVVFDAAIVGKVFWRGALERMRENGIVLSEALDSLEARDLIRRESRSWIERDDQFTFKYALIRDVAYATLPRARRKQLHGIVAAVPRGVDAGRGCDRDRPGASLARGGRSPSRARLPAARRRAGGSRLGQGRGGGACTARRSSCATNPSSGARSSASRRWRSSRSSTSTTCVINHVGPKPT